MQFITKNKNILLIIGGLLAVLVVIVILVSGGRSLPDETSDSVIQIKGDNGTLTVGRNGKVTLKTPKDEYSDVWDKDRISAFLNYLNENSSSALTSESYVVILTSDGGTATFAIGENDQLINTIIDDLVDGGGGSGDSGDDGDDPGDYFTTPTPTLPGGDPGGGGDDGDDGLPGGPGEDYGHPECAFWKLNYCADPLPTDPPTPVPTQSPVEDGVFLESYCEAWNELGIGFTIITNTVCVE